MVGCVGPMQAIADLFANTKKKKKKKSKKSSKSSKEAAPGALVVLAWMMRGRARNALAHLLCALHRSRTHPCMRAAAPAETTEQPAGEGANTTADADAVSTEDYDWVR